MCLTYLPIGRNILLIQLGGGRSCTVILLRYITSYTILLHTLLVEIYIADPLIGHRRAHLWLQVTHGDQIFINCTENYEVSGLRIDIFIQQIGSFQNLANYPNLLNISEK